MSSQSTYKRIKINWWAIIIFVGSYVHMIFAYIFQWGNNPIPKIGLIYMAIIWIIFILFIIYERFIFTIDDKFLVVKFGSYGWDIKIHVSQIKDVSVVKVAFRTYLESFSPKGTKYPFDFTRHAVNIQTKNDIIYQIFIKNAVQIKDEIEKRMLLNLKKSNNEQ